MNKYRATPGVTLHLQQKLSLKENNLESAEQEARALIDVHVNEYFTYVDKKLSWGQIYGEGGAPSEHAWLLMVSVIPKENILKPHADWLSYDYKKKVYVNRIIESEWVHLNEEERVDYLKQLSPKINNPKIVHTLFYRWEEEKKVAVFFYYE